MLIRAIRGSFSFESDAINPAPVQKKLRAKLVESSARSSREVELESRKKRAGEARGELRPLAKDVELEFRKKSGRSS